MSYIERREMKAEIIWNAEKYSFPWDYPIDIHIVTRDELDYFSEEKLIEMVNMVGFKDLEIKVIDCNLCSTLALFYIDVAKLRGKVESDTVDEYKRLIQLIRRIDEASLQTIIVKAKK